MTQRWLAERKNEYYYRKAKKLDYRSRAAFKLLQIDERFHIFNQGDKVLDLGAAPGGWLQVAVDLVGPEGRVVGIDLRPIKPVEGASAIIGDIRSSESMRTLRNMMGGKADIVISDMAPNISGAYSTDHARSVELCEYCLAAADSMLREGGSLIMKVFQGDLMEGLRRDTERRFDSVKVHSPDASRKTSSELYIIATGFRGSDVEEMEDTVEEKKPEFTKKGTFL